ncbi:MAG: hypothetical protein JW938_00675 [Candidatus Omnitrophica bacterium]|nr:hypothetical protein [Candidatus Omnitrophota bacterium]
MDSNDSKKRTLADHAHYYLSGESDSIPNISHNKDAVHDAAAITPSKTMVSLGHCTIQGIDPLRALVLLTPFYAQEFDQIYIITSTFNESHAHSVLPSLGFEQDPHSKACSFWNLQRTANVSVIQENYLLETLTEIGSAGGSDAQGRHDSNLSRLIIVDASGFGISFLDTLCAHLQSLFVISGKALGEVIESYQVIKAYTQVKPDLFCDYFFVADAQDTAGPIIRDKICAMSERFLNKRIRVTSLFPGDFFAGYDINDVTVSVCLRHLTLRAEVLGGSEATMYFFDKIHEYINGNAIII